MCGGWSTTEFPLSSIRVPCDYFAVKEVDFGDPTYPNDPPFIYLHDVETDSGDLDTSVSDIPGQNTDPPADKLFAWHVICLYLGPDGTYFDPWSGITCTSEADFLSKAVDAWGDTFAGGEIRWCPVSALPNEEIVFDTPPEE